MQKTWAPSVAGMLNILAGAVGIMGGIIAIIMFNMMFSAAGSVGTASQHPAYYTGILVIFIVLGLIDVVAITGGVMAVRRRAWGFAMIGAVCSILSIWGWLLGIAAIVLLVRSRQEFNLSAELEPVKLEDST
jgi:hypothetical protein